MQTGRPTSTTSLKGSIYKSSIEIEEVRNEVVALEIELSEAPVQEAELKRLLEHYCLLIEYYHFVDDTRRGNFFAKRWAEEPGRLESRG